MTENLTPAEHYAEAERLLADIAKADEQIKAATKGGEYNYEEIAALNAGMVYAVNIAQVHATLATAFVAYSPPPPHGGVK